MRLSKHLGAISGIAGAIRLLSESQWAEDAEAYGPRLKPTKSSKTKNVASVDPKDTPQPVSRQVRRQMDRLAAKGSRRDL